MALTPENSPPSYAAAAPGFGQQLATTSGATNAVAVPDAKANFPAGSSWTVEGRVAWDGTHRAILFSRGNVDTNALGSIFIGVDNGGNPIFQVVTPSGRVGGNYYSPAAPGAQVFVIAAVYKSGVGLTAYFNGVAHAFPDTDAWTPGRVAGTYIGRGYSSDPANIYQGTSTAKFDEVAISTVAQYSAAYTPSTSPFSAARKGQSALYHLDGSLADSNTNTNFTAIGGGGPTGPAPPTLSAPWAASALLPLWGNVYNALTDTRLPARLTADGLSGTPTDNLAHLNADTAWISAHGGGVLYLPAGTYYCATTTSAGIKCLPGVIIEGDGYDPIADADRTRLRFNAAGTASAYGIILAPGTAGTGFYNLSLEYAGPAEGRNPADAGGSTTVGRTITNDPQSGLVGNVLFKNVRIHQGAGSGISLNQIANLAVEDSSIDDPGNYNPLFLLKITGLTLTRTTASYKEGLFTTVYCPYEVVDGVSLVRRGGNPVVFRSGGTSAARTVDGGGFECGFSTGAVFKNCSVTTTGPLDLTSNDGECWVTQVGGSAYFSDRGTVGSYTAGVMSDPAKSWTQNWDPATYLLFFTGPAAGKYLPVLSHTATTVTTAPVSPAPNPGDTYAVEIPNALNITVQNCVFVHNNALIVEDGAIHCQFVGNTFLNSVGMQMVSYNYPHVVQPFWFNTITGNTISDPDGQNFSFLGMFTVRDSRAAPPVPMTMGNRVYGNILSGPPAGSAPRVKPNYAAFGIAGPGVYQRAMGGAPDPASIRDAPFPGVTNGVGPVPAAVSVVPATMGNL